MSKYLLSSLLFVCILTSCGSTRNASNENNQHQLHDKHEAVTTSFDDVDTANIVQNQLVAGQLPAPLTNLARTEEGAYVLSPGFYETDFKTYCLQPGTPSPSSKDAYFRAPLTGNRKEIIETILRNSQRKPNLDQKNVQLLLWSVVSKSNFDNLSYPVQSTARELLSPKQIFELRGGTMGVVKTVVSATGITGVNSDLQKLFDMGTSTYDAYERLAVLDQPSEIRRPDFKRDQWYKQEEGYYVRYLPDSYQHTKIQVYVPANLLDTTGKKSGEYVVFDPTTMVIVPAYSNAQRLGVGGAVVDVITQVIKIEKHSPLPPPRKTPPPVKTTKPQQ
jgi:hypothetical protein